MRLSTSIPAILIAVAAVATSTAASAQTGTWNFAVGASSDNRQRDISKSDGEASTWGRATWNSNDNGFYAQAAYETLDMGGADVGLAAFTGIRRSYAGYNIDLQASYKALIEADAGFDDDTFEVKADLTRNYGKTRTRLRAEYSPDGLGATKQWVWVSAYAAYPVAKNLSASAEIGYRDQRNNISYTGYNAGVTYAVTPKTGIDLRWHGTDGSPRTEQYKDKFVFGVTHNF